MMRKLQDQGPVPLDEGSELAHRAAKAWLDENDLVPLVLIALEVDEPVELVADRLVDHVRLDDIGMRAVPAEVVRQFLTERAEQTTRMEDQFRRLQEAHEPARVGGGVPALSDDASPLESLMAGDRSFVSPAEEFGGRPKPRFLEEELEAGARQQAAVRAEIEARKAAREGKDR